MSKLPKTPRPSRAEVRMQKKIEGNPPGHPDGRRARKLAMEEVVALNVKLQDEEAILRGRIFILDATVRKYESRIAFLEGAIKDRDERIIQLREKVDPLTNALRVVQESGLLRGSTILHDRVKDTVYHALEHV